MESAGRDTSLRTEPFHSSALRFSRKSLRDNSNAIFAVVSDVFILSYTRAKRRILFRIVLVLSKAEDEAEDEILRFAQNRPSP